MELLYVWVKAYKNIKEQGFNFSAQFKFDYNPVSKELTVSENENYIPDWYQDLFSSEEEIKRLVLGNYIRELPLP